MSGEFCKNGCLAENRDALTLEGLIAIGYIDFLKSKGYTPLVFEDGRLAFFPLSALPPGCEEGDKVEMIFRRLENDE